MAVVPAPDSVPPDHVMAPMLRLSAPVNVPLDRVSELSVIGVPVLRFKVPELTVTLPELKLVPAANVTVPPLTVMLVKLHVPLLKLTVPPLNCPLPAPVILPVKLCVPLPATCNVAMAAMLYAPL